MNHIQTANKWPLSRGTPNTSQSTTITKLYQQQQKQQHQHQQQHSQPIPATTNTFSRKLKQQEKKVFKIY